MFHTPGDPPKRGRIIFAIIGSIRNSSSEMTKIAMVKRMRTGNQCSMLGNGERNHEIATGLAISTWISCCPSPIEFAVQAALAK